MEELIIKEAEYREKIAQLTNQMNLPAFILKPVIKDLYDQLCNIEQEQYRQALAIKEEKAQEQAQQEEQDKAQENTEEIPPEKEEK